MRPATRSRLRPWLLLAVLLLTGIYFFTGPRSTQTSEIYQRTVAAMDARRRAPGSGGQAAAAQIAAEAKVRSGAGEEIVLDKVPDHEGGKGEQVSHKIGKSGEAGAGQAAGSSQQQQQQPLAGEGGEAVQAKQPKKPSVGGKVNDKVFEKDADPAVAGAVHGPADDAMGRKKVQGKPKVANDDDGVAKVGNTGKQGSSDSVLESPAARKVSELLDEILKKSPVIIFSKSYCPFSAKAKRILLDEYKIVPAPYVHEIDLMDTAATSQTEALGPALQSKLFEMTKRRTVPNVLVNGVSIGGGDDIEALDAAGKLADKIATIAGKRVMEIKRVKPDPHAGTKGEYKDYEDQVRAEKKAAKGKILLDEDEAAVVAKAKGAAAKEV